MAQDQYTKVMEVTGRNQKYRSINLVLRVYTWLGSMIALGGAGYFVISFFKFELTAGQLNALLFTGVGVALSIASKAVGELLLARRSAREEEVDESVRWMQFLDVWKEFEKAAREVLAHEGEQFNVHSVRSILSALFKEGKINAKDVAFLDMALKLRNALVHSPEPAMASVPDLLTTQVWDIVGRLQRDTEPRGYDMIAESSPIIPIEEPPARNR